MEKEDHNNLLVTYLHRSDKLINQAKKLQIFIESRLSSGHMARLTSTLVNTFIIPRFEQLPNSQESTPPLDVTRVKHLRNLLEHRQDDKADAILLTTAWKHISKTVGRLDCQNVIDKWKTKLIDTRGGTLDITAYENENSRATCNYLEESKLSKHDVVLFYKPMYQQIMFHGLATEFENTTKEDSRNMLIRVMDFQELWKINVSQYRANHKRQYNKWIPESCAKDNVDELCLHLDDKIKELKKCYNSTDVQWKEKLIWLERIENTKKYCDQFSAFVANSVQYSEEQKLWFEMQTEDILNTINKLILQFRVTSNSNDGLCSEPLSVVNDDNEESGVSVQIGDGAFEEKYHFSKQQRMECQMCIDQNNALYWCKNCKMNICSFCKMYHETVWTVMNHDVYPLSLLS